MSTDRFDPTIAATIPELDLDYWESEFAGGEPRSLTDLLNRVLDRGVVIAGDITLSVAGVDLVYLGLNAVLTSISTARAAGRGLGRLPASDEGDAG